MALRRLQLGGIRLEVNPRCLWGKVRGGLGGGREVWEGWGCGAVAWGRGALWREWRVCGGRAGIVSFEGLTLSFPPPFLPLSSRPLRIPSGSPPQPSPPCASPGLVPIPSP